MTLYSIPDMTCGHCRSAVTQTVQAVDPAATLTFDMALRQVQIDSTAAPAPLLAALAAEGYPATPV